MEKELSSDWQWKKKYTGAAVLIALGVLIFLHNIGTLNIGTALGTYWPVILIVIGLSRMISSRPDWTGGTFFLVLGGALQMLMLGMLTESMLNFWPILLVLFGLYILFRPKRRFPKFKYENPKFKYDMGRDNATVEEELDTLAVFSGQNLRIETDAFPGGEATALFGGITIDLTRATIKTSPVILNVLAIFGGIEIIIPPTWTVENNISAILGGVDDTRRITMNDPAQIQGRIIIEGKSIFGGVGIRN